MKCKITNQYIFYTLNLLFMLVTFNASAQIGNEDRVMMIQTNLVVDPAEDVLSRIERAKNVGANTVIFSDSKLNIYGLTGTAGSQWDQEIIKLVAGVKALDMKLYLATVTMGFNGSLLSSDVHLTTGYPIRNQPLKVVEGKLQPIETTSISNGGFEFGSNNLPDGWKQPDEPGVLTFIDNDVKHSGNASFRADAKNGKMARIFGEFDVIPFHQYTLSLWLKTENLTANNLLALIRDQDNLDRTLTNLSLSIPAQNGGRKYFKSPNNLTLDWTEVRISFNSQNASTINLGLTLFGGQSGSVWWDDIALEDSPFLNWINRSDLLVSAKKNNTALNIGTDIAIPSDPLLGKSTFTGKYDTQHPAPIINVPNGSSLSEGDEILISGYHALPTGQSAQVSGSWNHPDMFDKIAQIHSVLHGDFSPDGYLLNYSEVRTGGWEPYDLDFDNSGAAFANSIRTSVDRIKNVTNNAPLLFWNDMIDPNHNATPNYYQINNTMSGSWEGLRPQDFTILTWWEGQKIVDKGPSSLNFFSDRGFKQWVGAFYDAPVSENYNQWQAASEGIEDITGSIYATWVKDYSQIEPFGSLWWSDAPSALDTIYSIEGPKAVMPNKSYDIAVSYEVSEPRDLVINFQLNEVPWTNYGTKRIRIDPSLSVSTISIKIDDDIPSGIDKYKWTSILTPIGQGWPDRLDDVQLEEIDVLDNESESFYIRNEASERYLRPLTDATDARILVTGRNNADIYKWILVEVDDSHFHLLNKGTGKYFRPKDIRNNTGMFQKPTSWSGGWTQWRKILSEDGRTFHLENRATKKYIRPNRTTRNSLAVQISNRVNTLDTRWTFEETNRKSMIAITRNTPSTSLLNVFPNPFSDQITVGLEQPNREIKQIFVSDIYGRQVFKKNNIDKFNEESNIQLLHLPEGIYTVQVITKDNQIFSQIIIK